MASERERQLKQLLEAALDEHEGKVLSSYMDHLAAPFPPLTVVTRTP